MVLALGHAHPFERLGAGIDHPDAVGVGQANILGCKDVQPTKDEPRVLSGSDHLGQPIERRIGVAPAHGLDEGGGCVVVLIAGLIVAQCALLD